MADHTPTCYVCHRRIDRSKERPTYIYPIPRTPVDLRAGAYACPTCAPEELRRQGEMGIVVPVGSGSPAVA